MSGKICKFCGCVLYDRIELRFERCNVPARLPDDCLLRAIDAVAAAYHTHEGDASAELAEAIVRLASARDRHPGPTVLPRGRHEDGSIDFRPGDAVIVREETGVARHGVFVAYTRGAQMAHVKFDEREFTERRLENVLHAAHPGE